MTSMTRVAEAGAAAAPPRFEDLRPRAFEAAACLKALAHEKRLMAVCHLAGGERSVGELARLLSMPPSALSQDLARLRLGGLVDRRRVGKSMHYRLVDARVERLVEALRGIFDPDVPEAR